MSTSPVGQMSEPEATETSMGMSTDELIIHVERQMREFERNAQYLEAEQARLHLKV